MWSGVKVKRVKILKGKGERSEGTGVDESFLYRIKLLTL